MRGARVLLLATLASAAVSGSAGDRVRISDDYERALAEARARGVPLLVEAWAPW